MNQDELPDHQSVNSHNNIEIRVMEPKQPKQVNPFSVIRVDAPNLLGTGLFVDDQFKLNANSQAKNIVIKRLSELYQPGTPLFMDIKTGRDFDKPTKKIINMGSPTYLSELNMLPFHHFKNLIEPPYINEKGYYHVVMWKQGIMYKEVIDDTMYYDETIGKILSHPEIEDHPWLHILLKAWAKKNKGYQASEQCLGFEFLKNFSYPDWQYINPSNEKQEYLNTRFSKATSNEEFMVCMTKSNPQVGNFGFTPNCSSFIIRRHYQEYADIFLIIEPFVHDCWNKLFCSKQSQFPSEEPEISSKQFLIPITEFLNVFHLIFTTKNKYYFPKSQKKSSIPPVIPHICYERYILNVDALDTKAIVLGLQINQWSSNYRQLDIPVTINFYFPSMKVFDIINKPRHGFHMPGDLVVPWAKIIIAQSLESGNADASYVESVKQKILDYGQNLMGFAQYNPAYQYIMGEYFHGYSNQLTFNLMLKPGKYYMRIKIEQKQAQYRCHINSTAINGNVKIFDPKVNDKQQLLMLKDSLISKAKKQKKCITYINPIKKGSWIICRNEIDLIGYGYIVIQAIKNAENIIVMTIDPRKLKQFGYQAKGHKKQINQKRIQIKSEQTFILMLKYEKQWNGGERVWPPPGIEFRKIPKHKVKDN